MDGYAQFYGIIRSATGGRRLRSLCENYSTTGAVQGNYLSNKLDWIGG